MKRNLIKVAQVSLGLGVLSIGSCAYICDADPHAQGTTMGRVKIQGLGMSSVVRYNFDTSCRTWTPSDLDVHREPGSTTIAKLAGATADIMLGTSAIRHSTAALKEAKAYEKIANDGLQVHGMDTYIDNSSSSHSSNTNTNHNSATSSSASNSASSARQKQGQIQGQFQANVGGGRPAPRPKGKPKAR